MSITINGQIIRVRIGVGQQVVDVRINDGWLQIKYNFTGWINYIQLSELQGNAIYTSLLTPGTNDPVQIPLDDIEVPEGRSVRVGDIVLFANGKMFTVQSVSSTDADLAYFSSISTTTNASWGIITGNIQDQTDLKAELDAKQDTITGAASSVLTSDLSAQRVVVTDNNGKIAAGSITTTILNYLSGLTGNAQDQIDNKLNKVWTDLASQTTVLMNDEVVINRTGAAFKTTVANILANVVSGDIFEVVMTLPVTGQPNKIYLVPSDDPEDGNEYEEYIWLNSAWELIGSVTIDLTNYYTKDEIDLILAGYATTAALTSGLDGKVDKSPGFGLSQENFTTALKDKLEGLAPYFNWKDSVDNYAELLTTTGNQPNDAYFNLDDGRLYIWNGTNFPADGNGIPLVELFTNIFENKDLAPKIDNMVPGGAFTYIYPGTQRTLAAPVSKTWTSLRRIGFWVRLGNLTSGTGELVYTVYTTTTVNNLSIISRTLKTEKLFTFPIAGEYTYLEVDLGTTIMALPDEILCVSVSSPEFVGIATIYSIDLPANNIVLPQARGNTVYEGPPINPILPNFGQNSSQSYLLALLQADQGLEPVLTDQSLNTNVLAYDGIVIAGNGVSRPGTTINAFPTFKTLALPVLTDLSKARKITIYVRLDGQVVGQTVTLNWGVFSYYLTANNQNPYTSNTKTWIKQVNGTLTRKNDFGDFTALELDLSDIKLPDEKVAIYLTSPYTISYLTSGDGNKRYDAVNNPSIGFHNVFGTVNNLSLVNQASYIDNTEVLYRVEYADSTKRGFSPEAIQTIDELSYEPSTRGQFVLPSRLYMPVSTGADPTETNFYFDSLFTQKWYNIKVVGNNIVGRGNRVFITPGTNPATQTITFVDTISRVSHKMEFITIARNGGSGVKYGVIVSDSLVNQDPVAKYVQDKLTADFNTSGGANITLVGTQDTNGGKHEGNPSWKWEDWLTKASFATRTNPFWDGTRVNIPLYCSNRGIPQLDFTVFGLGTNDVLQGVNYYETEAQEDALIDYVIVFAKGLIAAFLDPTYGNPNMKIGINTIQYGTTGYQKNNFERLAMKLNIRYIQEFHRNDNYPNVYVNCSSCVINRDLAYPTVNLSAGTAYVPTTLPERNEVHPIIYTSGGNGYKEVSHLYYAMFRLLASIT